MAKLGLPWNRVFFAQEAFFGTGVDALGEYFDVAICKDDYLTYYYDIDVTNQCFELGGIKVVVASNHLLNELSSSLKSDATLAARYRLCEDHLQHLRRASELNNPVNFPGARGQHGQTEWLWYHCGDGNHFGSIHKPDDLARCYYDQVWSSFCLDRIDSYRETGYELGTIRDLASSLDYSDAKELPPLIEGSWNPRGAVGVTCGMGRNCSPWENDHAVLTAIARARARIVTAERLVEVRPHEDHTSAQSRLDEAWSVLLHSQISDALGWEAGPQAVMQALLNADQALVIANEVLGEFAEELDVDCRTADPAHRDLDTGVIESVCPEVQLIGADGTGSYTHFGQGVEVFECRFRATGATCGVRFPFLLDYFVFCPSGKEREPLRIPGNILKQNIITLPLANGLLQIGEDLFLIKDTGRIHLAGAVNVHERYVDFCVGGAREGQEYTWRFYLVKASLPDAVGYANSVNYS